MEVSQFGDTEIQAPELKSAVEKLKACNKDALLCKMEEDFEVVYLLTFYFSRIFLF